MSHFALSGIHLDGSVCRWNWNHLIWFSAFGLSCQISGAHAWFWHISARQAGGLLKNNVWQRGTVHPRVWVPDRGAARLCPRRNGDGWHPKLKTLWHSSILGHYTGSKLFFICFSSHFSCIVSCFVLPSFLFLYRGTCTKRNQYPAKWRGGHRIHTSWGAFSTF